MWLDLSHLEQWSRFIVYAAGALGVLWGVWKWLKTRRDNWKSFFQRIDTLQTGLTEVQVSQKTMKDQMGVNGGKSLRDAIDRIEDTVRRSEARQSAIGHAFSRPLFETNAKGLYVHVNHAYEELTGFSLDELLGNGWFSAVYIEDRRHIATEWAHAVKDQRLFRADFRLLTGAGSSSKQVYMEATPMRDIVEKETIGWFGTITVRDNPTSTPGSMA
jgi:PAS domain S-box-containing protein